MRLLRTNIDINDSTLVLEEFDGQSIPPYAILSHTWEADEVLFTDVLNDTAVSRSGYSKIRGAIQQAEQDGYEHIWIDACCIDKGSSAEPSEAINSMYAWYEGANVCYAYLADVTVANVLELNEPDFANSRWFTRGWRLQELLAPFNLVFYSKEWFPLGNKHMLSSLISPITNISIDVLTHTVQPSAISVATRMHWASARQTSREDDKAYSLMGIFGVNMPMLSGEGKRAFQRLQEEIMRYSDGQSLFVWVDSTIPNDQPHGLFADSPAAFAKYKHIEPYANREEGNPFEMTKKGLRIHLHLAPLNDGSYAAALDCLPPSGKAAKFATAFLRKSAGTRQYARVRCAEVTETETRGLPQLIFVKRDFLSRSNAPIYPAQTHYFFKISLTANTSGPYESTDTGYFQLLDHVKPGDQHRNYGTSQLWHTGHSESRFCVIEGVRELAVALQLRFVSSGVTSVFTILFGTLTGVDFGFNVVESSSTRLLPLETLRKLFQPQPIDMSVRLGRCVVRINDRVSVNSSNLFVHALHVVVEPIIREDLDHNLTNKVDSSKKSGITKMFRHGFGKMIGNEST